MPEEITGGSDPKRKLRVYVATFGCQMNVYDSEVAEGLLEQAGFEIVRERDGVVGANPCVRPEQERGQTHGSSPANADVVLMNTCSVREHAEDRVFSRLGMLGKTKKTNPNLIVGLMGCMVEEHREKLFKRFPQLDLMIGTRNIKKLPSLIEEVRRTRKQVSQIKQDGISIEYTDLIKRHSRLHAWLPIMTGCNKVCTFCIVPITRGAEVSMPEREVYREASRLVGEGVKAITLLGQNVNSYEGQGAGGKGQGTSFPELLGMLCEIKGLERIMFTTSHPSDATEELYRVIAKNPKISRRFHLPLQSGSNRILKRMKRLHTYEGYKEKIDLMREIIPEVSITTDIIAGFSGETEEDHRATVRALEEIRYDGAYIYKYSVRSGTPASKLHDDVPIEVKEKRHAELLETQRRVSDEVNRSFIGKTVEVLVEEISTKDCSELLGRTHQEKKIVFPGEKALLGSVQKVTLKDLRHETFLGTLSRA